MVFGKRITEEQEKANKAKLDLIFGSSNTYKKENANTFSDDKQDKIGSKSISNSIFSDERQKETSIFSDDVYVEELSIETKEKQIRFKDLDISHCEIKYNLWSEECNSLSIYYTDEDGTEYVVIFATQEQFVEVYRKIHENHNVPTDITSGL